LVALALAALAGCKSKEKAPEPGSATAAAANDAAPVAEVAVDAAAEEPELPPPDVAPAEPPRRLWTNELMTEQAWLDYSKEQGGERFSKFVVDLKSDAIYYFDVDVYRLHKDFIFG